MDKKIKKVIEQLEGILTCPDNNKMHDPCKVVLKDQLVKLRSIVNQHHPDCKSYWGGHYGNTLKKCTCRKLDKQPTKNK